MALHCTEVLAICLGSDHCSAGQWAACQWREPCSILKNHFYFSWAVTLLSIYCQKCHYWHVLSLESTRKIHLIWCIFETQVCRTSVTGCHCSQVWVCLKISDFLSHFGSYQYCAFVNIFGCSSKAHELSFYNTRLDKLFILNLCFND